MERKPSKPLSRPPSAEVSPTAAGERTDLVELGHHRSLVTPLIERRPIGAKRVELRELSWPVGLCELHKADLVLELERRVAQVVRLGRLQLLVDSTEELEFSFEPLALDLVADHHSH